MKTWLKRLIAVLLMAALVVAGLLLRHQRQQQLADAAPPVQAPWALRVAEVSRGRATEGFPALALVKGDQQVAISAQLSGILLEMNRREGEQVAAGDRLARIDTRELEDKLASLEAQHLGAVADAERLQRDSRRADEVLQKHGISESDADRQRAAAAAAQEKVNSLAKDIAAERTRLGYATLSAPFAGVISQRLADPGDLATVGKALYRLIGTASSRLEVKLPAAVLAQVAIGSEVEISQADGSTASVRAARVYPSLDERSLGRLEIDLPGLPPGSVPGSQLHARVITAALDDVLLVPANALLGGDAQASARVFKVISGQSTGTTTLASVPVQVLMHSGAQVAIKGPLQAGDQVVTAHHTTLLRLRDGDALRVTAGARP